jgi:KipI family sensor histidine kinase inhibitor
MTMRFLPISVQTLLVELDDLDATLVLFDALLADPVPGVAEIVPAARTLMIRTLPGVAADAALARAVLIRRPAAGARPAPRAAETVELPMIYDGEDLADVAAHLGLTEAEVIAAHQQAAWQVAFCGFAPGFAYMRCDDTRFDLPRRPTPRMRIPAGSVALAGRFCGVYPQQTPGGWQLIGRTGVPMWDLSRDPAALLRPGMRCRFVERRAVIYPSTAIPAPQPASGLRILATAFPIVFQDEGRPGQAGQGVSASGALDRGALRRANRAVGNPSDAPALEITLGPVRLRADTAMLLALSGAASARVGGQAIPRGSAFAVDAGDEITLDSPAAGMRSYLALRGGYAVATVLGSAASDTLALVGPEPLKAGSVIAPAGRPAVAVQPQCEPELPGADDLVLLAVTLGPRADWFSAAMIRKFLAQEWRVTPQSSRVGIRLQGEPVTRADARELASEGTETGAIQIPHSGQPVLFLADHPLTGGYPVIATLRPEALDLADPGHGWHAERDRIDGFAAWMAGLAGSLGKMGEDLILMAQSGIGEIRLAGAGGSSTMPQKQNPVGPSVLVALARQAIALCSAIQSSGIHRQQRDGAAWFVEWLTLPQLCISTGRAIALALELSERITPDARAMARGLDDGSGLIHAEAYVFALARHMPRPEAQARIKELCKEAGTGGTPLPGLVARDFPDLDLKAAGVLGAAPAEARAFAAMARG